MRHVPLLARCMQFDQLSSAMQSVMNVTNNLEMVRNATFIIFAYVQFVLVSVEKIKV